jgi:class 3 adenylate cyclase
LSHGRIDLQALLGVEFAALQRAANAKEIAMADARVERRLAAIFAADVAGYSRLMRAGDVAILRGLKAHPATAVSSNWPAAKWA